MPIEKGKDKGPGQRQRPDKYTPNKVENAEVRAAIQSAGFKPTEENCDIVHRAISGQSAMDYWELVKFIKDLPLK